MSAYLFDLDGTLASSEVLKGRALALACASYGADANHSVYAEVMGEAWPTVTGHFFKTHQIKPDSVEFDNRFRDLYVDLIETELLATEGAEEFVLKCRSVGVKIGLVSSAASWMVEKVLSKLDLRGVFDPIVTKEHVARHKPDPEAYLLALSRLNLDPGDVLVFEDSSAGLKAALSAGCQCVVVRHAFNTKHDFTGSFCEVQSFNNLTI